jgi:hypothetical protein
LPHRGIVRGAVSLGATDDPEVRSRRVETNNTRRYRPAPTRWDYRICGGLSAGCALARQGENITPHIRHGQQIIASQRALIRSWALWSGALMISMANPRHEHEYRCFERHRLPVGTNLIATTNHVEHPDIVAERPGRVAQAIGDPRRVLAGTNCGFETTVGRPRSRGSCVG